VQQAESKTGTIGLERLNDQAILNGIDTDA
jgi:hypothetical protein